MCLSTGALERGLSGHMAHIGEKKNACRVLVGKIRKERDSLKNLGVDRILLLRRNLMKCEGKPLTEAVWLMIGTDDLVVKKNFPLHKTRGFFLSR
jgi:hypothetical protein